MKRLTLEATDENILASIKNNTYYRNSDVAEFVQAIDDMEGNMFISLDARWGEGKTFYVRQIEKTLEYLTKKKAESEQPDITADLKPYFEKTELNRIELDNTYLPIYYNAWQYDNHDDPLMSLVFTIVKKAQVHLDSTLNTSVGEKVKKLLSALSISANYGVAQGSVNINGENIINAFEAKDILANIKLAEDIHAMVKELINEAIVEKAQRLVIFVDELDRCRPTYSIEMLERIKHYFDDDRIIFVVSVNKEQLVHTISKHYGYGFDSSAYLNKFFDLNTNMPKIKMNDYLYSTYDNTQFLLTSIANGLNRYHGLTIRDSMILHQRIQNMDSRIIHDTTSQGRCFSLFIPIILVLDIIDQNEKTKFLNGTSTVLGTYLSEVQEITKMLRRMASEDNYEKACDKYQELYKKAFGKNNPDEFVDLPFNINRNFKELCIKYCNFSEKKTD